MRIRWTADAAEDLAHHVAHIREQNPVAALRIARTVVKAIASLSALPRRGRPGEVEGTRELVLSPLPYIAVYRVRESTIEVLHIWHGAQEWR